MTHLPESLQLLAAAQHALTHTQPTVVVRVLATRGSSPRLAGALMLVSGASVCGTVGGGHLEFVAIGLARSKQLLPFEKTFPLGAALGQCCGGAMTLRFEPLDANHLTELAAQCAAFKTLYLFGAGHVARAVQLAVAALPLQLRWIDSRDAVNTHQSTFPDALPAHATTLVSEAPEYELKTAKTGDLALIMTHSHALDEAIALTALRTPQLAYIGLIGSATKRRLFEQRWLARGVQSQVIDRLVCPVGVAVAPSPHSKLPAVIAACIAAQLTQYV